MSIPNSTDGSASWLGLWVLKSLRSMSHGQSVCRGLAMRASSESASSIRNSASSNSLMAIVRSSMAGSNKARRILEERSDVALVTGRRRERFPEQSIYNRLADLEWDTPVGEIDTSHGDVMVRVDAFRQDRGV